MTGQDEHTAPPDGSSDGQSPAPANGTPPAGDSKRVVPKMKPAIAKTIKRTKMNEPALEPESQDAPAANEQAVPPSEEAKAAPPPEEAKAAPPAEQAKSGPPPGFMPPPPPPDLVPWNRKVAKLNPVIARTKLDLDACKQVVERLISDKEIKASEDNEARPKEQPRPPQPIESYRRATPCASQWNAMSGTERFRMCNQCKLYLYDFTNLELKEAQDIVFQREGKEVTSLYRRKDGKFLVKDCPVGVARAHKMLAIIAAGVLLVGAAIASVCLMPPPPAPPQQPQVTEETPPSDAKPTGTQTQLPEPANMTLPAGAPSPNDGVGQPDQMSTGSPPVEMHDQKLETQPSAGASPSGRYVTVPVEVFQSATQNQQTPATQPAPNQSGNSATPAQTPAGSPAAAPAQAPAAVPAQSPAPVTVPTQTPAPAAQTSPPPESEGNPYVKNYK